ncbi:hypothetical protein SH601_13615 [Gracilibacillus sp. S3-1-1]|uniref:Uncharacterized protein n=1 Tax=Gracilibacillus pellucidus TaxID=3095368 RepID=A0ACC6M816_9BACI|nr:hypothetical protein [Gracilibacillus sp. S3-1-1]MDX8047026.1 hypothetical protein [Gracilibacillus sp. S3-1-1]
MLVGQNLNRVSGQLSDQPINDNDQSISDKVAVTAKLTLPVWGNWCGPGHGEGSTKDLLDKACMYHDKDYAEHGYFDCKSDALLILRIQIYYDRMGFTEKAMARAVQGYFTAQMTANGCSKEL